MKIREFEKLTTHEQGALIEQLEKWKIIKESENETDFFKIIDKYIILISMTEKDSGYISITRK